MARTVVFEATNIGSSPILSICLIKSPKNGFIAQLAERTFDKRKVDSAILSKTKLMRLKSV